MQAHFIPVPTSFRRSVPALLHPRTTYVLDDLRKISLGIILYPLPSRNITDAHFIPVYQRYLMHQRYLCTLGRCPLSFR